MAQQTITTTVLGVEKLHRKLNDDIPQEFKRMLFKIRGHALKEAKEKAKPHEGDIGAIANSIKASASVVSFSARVWTPIPAARQVEEGRKPGKPPTARALQRWMKRHGLRADFKSVRLLQRRMKTGGTKGVKFMEKAGQDTQQKLPEFINEAEASIKKAWAA